MERKGTARTLPLIAFVTKNRLGFFAVQCGGGGKSGRSAGMSWFVSLRVYRWMHDLLGLCMCLIGEAMDTTRSFLRVFHV